jgi:hypothetical protein
MIRPTQKEILEKLFVLCELAPEVRFGQLVAQLGFLAEDAGMRGLWDIEDDELLRVIEAHEADLSRRGAEAHV